MEILVGILVVSVVVNLVFLFNKFKRDSLSTVGPINENTYLYERLHKVENKVGTALKAIINSKNFKFDKETITDALLYN